MTMTIRRELTLAGLLAVALLAFGFAAGDAGAKGKYKQATFTAEIAGTQTYKSTYDHESTGRCDHTIHSLVNEKLRFASTKKVKVTFMKIPGQKMPIVTSGKKGLRLPTRASVDRSNSNSVTDLPEDCGGNGGGGPITPPDCGTRSINPLWFYFDYYKPGRIELLPEDLGFSSPWKNCGSGLYPNFFNGDTSLGKRQSASLGKEIFDEDLGKIITIGRGHQDLPLIEGHDVTDVRWELTLYRVKNKK
jgi:hypothetical protein